MTNLNSLKPKKTKSVTKIDSYTTLEDLKKKEPVSVLEGEEPINGLENENPSNLLDDLDTAIHENQDAERITITTPSIAVPDRITDQKAHRSESFHPNLLATGLCIGIVAIITVVIYSKFRNRGK